MVELSCKVLLIRSRDFERIPDLALELEKTGRSLGWELVKRRYWTSERRRLMGTASGTFQPKDSLYRPCDPRSVDFSQEEVTVAITRINDVDLQKAGMHGYIPCLQGNAGL
jgi:hypothetical protein